METLGILDDVHDGVTLSQTGGREGKEEAPFCWFLADRPWMAAPSKGAPHLLGFCRMRQLISLTSFYF